MLRIRLINQRFPKNEIAALFVVPKSIPIHFIFLLANAFNPTILISKY